MLIYKIMSQAEWSSFQENQRFTGSAVDLADGFIHFSTATQMVETARRYFAGRDDLMLVWTQGDALGKALKLEPSRGGDLFPHLYRDWLLSEVTGHAPLPSHGDGHIFPDGHL